MNSKKNIQKTTSEKMFYYLLNYFSSKNILKIIPVILLLSLNAQLAIGQCPGTCPLGGYTETIINVCNPTCAKNPTTCLSEPNSFEKCQLITFDVTAIATNCGVDITGCMTPTVSMTVFQGCGQMSTSNISYYDVATCTGGMTGANGEIELDLNSVGNTSYILCSTSNNLSFGTISITGCCDLTATATGTDVSCNGDNDGTITIIPMNGTAPYTWAATGGLTGSGLTVSNLTTGNYVITLTDADGCMAVTNPVTINQPASAVDAQCARDKDVSCFGDSDGQVSVTAVGGTPPYTYQWDASAGSSTNQVVAGLPAGLYFVTATDAKGCTEACAAQVNQPTSAVDANCSRDKDVSCFGGSDGQVSVSAVGGTPPYTYQWAANAGSSTNQVVAGLPAGVYTVTATDANGCTNACAAQVNQPASAFDAQCARLADASCFGASDGVVQVTGVGGTPPYTFQWGANAGSSTNQMVTGLPAGLYSVTATDANGCQDICAAQVNDPVPSIMCPSPGVFECGDDAGVQAWLMSYTLTNVCNTAIVMNDYNPADFNKCITTTKTITFTVKNAAGQTIADCSTQLTINAAAAPMVTIPPIPSVMTCAESGAFTAPHATYNNNQMGACNISGSLTPMVVGQYNPCTGTTFTVNYTGSDECGNPLSASTTYFVQAAPTPVLTPPALPASISCTQAVGFMAADATYNNQIAGPLPPFCQISGSIAATVTPMWDKCGGTIIVEYSGMSASCNHPLSAGPFVITVDPAPEAVVSPVFFPTNISCVMAETFVAPNTDYNNGITGACNISGMLTPVITNNWTECGGMITVNYSGMDMCGRPLASGPYMITVDPAPAATVTAPVFPTSISCAMADVFTANDATYNNQLTGACHISGSITATVMNNWTNCGGTITVSYGINPAFTDQCGRPLMAGPYTINVEPAPEATVTVPFVPSTISCVDATTYTAPTASYNNQLTGTCNISGTIMPNVTPAFDKCGGTISIIYSSQDECGRPLNASRIITVLPAPAPTLMPPSFPSQVTCAEGVALIAPHAFYTNGISGTCNISGYIEANVVKNINACLYSNITITYNGYDDCGNYLSAGPFTVLVEPAPAPALVQPNLPMMIDCWEAPTYDPGPLYYTNNESGVCERSGYIYPIVTPLWDGCDGGNIIVKWVGADLCGYALETEWYVVMVMPDEIAPIGECAPIAVNLTYLDDVPGPDDLYDYKYQIANEYWDYCSGVVVTVVGDSGEQPCQLDGTFERVYQMEVADECGNVADTCEVRFYGACNPLYCTLSQSFYGGQWDNDELFGYSSLEIIDSLIGFGEDSILIGSGTSDCGFILDDATCIRTIISGQGTSYPLWPGFNLNCDATLQNVLVNQIITTTLNVRYNALFNNGLDFGNFQLSAACQNLPNDLVDDLPANATVNDLLDYANDFLACQCDGTCGDFDNFINHELTGIFLALNSRFHECHVPGPCTIVDDCYVVNDDNMVGLDARNNGYDTKIDWTMLNDLEVDKYELERSADGINFTNLGEIIGKQSVEARSYGFTDENPTEGTNFYRLKVFHVDGGFCYTDTRQVDIELPYAEVNLFPNPTNHRINLSVHGFVGKAGQVMIANNQGVVLKEQSYDAIPQNVLQFDVQDYVSGMYWITIKVDGHKSVTKKFIVSKLDFQELRN